MLELIREGFVCYPSVSLSQVTKGKVPAHWIHLSAALRLAVLRFSRELQVETKTNKIVSEDGMCNCQSCRLFDEDPLLSRLYQTQLFISLCISLLRSVTHPLPRKYQQDLSNPRLGSPALEISLGVDKARSAHGINCGLDQIRGG